MNDYNARSSGLWEKYREDLALFTVEITDLTTRAVEEIDRRLAVEITSLTENAERTKAVLHRQRRTDIANRSRELRKQVEADLRKFKADAAPAPAAPQRHVTFRKDPHGVNHYAFYSDGTPMHPEFTPAHMWQQAPEPPAATAGSVGDDIRPEDLPVLQDEEDDQ